MSDHSAVAVGVAAAPPFYLNQRNIRWAFWACALGVLVLSLLPSNKVLVPTTGWDKADHFLAYAVLGALACGGWAGRAVTVLAALLLFGIVIEGLQAMTGYRSAELQDVYAEALGLGLGFAFAAIVIWTLGRINAAAAGRVRAVEESR